MAKDNWGNWLILLLIVGNSLTLFAHGGTSGLVGGLLLFAVPGWAMSMLLFGRSQRIGFWGKLLLGLALGYVLGNLVVSALILLPVKIRIGELAGALDMLSLALLIPLWWRDRQRKEPLPISQGPIPIWFHVFVLLVILSFFRFYDLGFTEFSNGDEIPILYLTETLMNDGSSVALLEHLKGPGEIMTTLAFTTVHERPKRVSVAISFCVGERALRFTALSACQGHVFSKSRFH